VRGRAVNIAEVAAAAGVGVGTVSRVLNGSQEVRDSTRRRVLAVMERLDYRPSRLASGLSLGTTRAVAVLVPFLTRPSVVARLAGVLAVLDHEGLDPLVCSVDTPEQRDRHLAAFAERHRADGMLAVSLPLRREHVTCLRSQRVPLVAVDADCPGVPRVVVDNAAGGRMATEYLVRLGHTRIAFVGDRPNKAMGFVSTRRRMAGYREALRAHGIPRDPSLEQRGPHGAAWSAAAIEALLRGPTPPTAVFAASDTQALGVLRAAERAGRRVPEDLSVVGFDDIEAAGLLGLSTVRQPLQRSGELGARLLCDLLRGVEPQAQRTVLPLDLVARASAAPPTDRLRPTPLGVAV
jgi:DNA-binding LacI/PurR family transcriptional regulator